MYNNTVARYIEDINLNYGVALSYAHLEVSEIGHWTETIQVAALSNNQQQPQQPTQNQEQTLQVSTMATQVQVQTGRDQQAEIDRLTNVAAQWSTGEPCRVDNSYVNNNKHQSSRQQSTPNMSLVTHNYNWQYMYSVTHWQQSHGHYSSRSHQYNRQEMDQRRYSQNLQSANNNNVKV